MNDASMLRGRRRECAVLGVLLEGVRNGRSGVLVLRGEAGIGKTALLDYAVASAAGLRVLRATGVEPEMELAFAGLHQLCGPMLNRLGRLPDPQRAALETAFGLAAGPAPDRFLVGLAVLNLLSQVAGEGPLVCVVDDAQWLDRPSVQALAFAARRLPAEPLLVLFAAQEPGADFRGLPELGIEGLGACDARELMDSAIRWPMDERVREQIVAETRGNPLALLDLPRALSPVELAGGFRLSEALPLPGPVEQDFLRRVEGLPGATRLLLLAAAAEPTGDPVLLRRAARRLGVPDGAATPAAEAGLLELGARCGSGICRSARRPTGAPRQRTGNVCIVPSRRSPTCKRTRIATPGTGLRPRPGPTRLLPPSSSGPPGLAQERAGLVAAATFLERAAALTPDPAQRAERALAAAQAKIQAGPFDALPELLGVAKAGPQDELRHARIDFLHARLAFASNRGRDASPLLLKAARRLEGSTSTWPRGLSGHHERRDVRRPLAAPGGGALEVSRAACAAPRPSDRRARPIFSWMAWPPASPRGARLDCRCCTGR